MNKKYQAPAAEKLLNIIELMAKNYRAYTVTELASELDITVNSVFRIIKELEARDYVEKDMDSMTYKLTGKLFYLGNLVGENIGFRSVCAKYLNEIADITGETTLLGILDNNFHTIIIDQVVSKQMLKFISTVGGSYPTNTSVLGKAMLSALPSKDLEHFFAIYDMQKPTKKSIVSIETMKKDIKAARERGYFIDDEESCIGIRCVGIPIVDFQHNLHGAICISGPAYRINDKVIKQSGRILLRVSCEISQKLGTKA